MTNIEESREYYESYQIFFWSGEIISIGNGSVIITILNDGIRIYIIYNVNEQLI